MSETQRNIGNVLDQNTNTDSVISKKKVALVCSSNGLTMQVESQVQELVEYLQGIGLEPILSPYLYATDGVEAGTARQRAETLMEYYYDPEIGAIYDLSGGDIANEVLPLLDYDVIATSNKIFWGYSDLTTLLNAIYAKTGKPSVLYQVRNLVREENDLRKQEFASFVQQYMMGEKESEQSPLFDFTYEWTQGEPKQGEWLEGIVVGGNIRCLLKLAGTPYWPDMTDKILLMEARSGGVAQMTTYLGQLQQMGVFGQIRGILLGTFTQMEREKAKPDIVELVRRFAGGQVPIARTAWIGHGADSKAIVIGEEIFLK